MDALFKLTIQLHVAFIWIMFLIALANIFLLNESLSVSSVKKRVRALLPIYYMFFSLVLFTALILFGAVQFSNIYLSVVLMTIVWVFMLVTTIKTYKKMKILNEKGIKEYIRFYKIKYISDMFLIVVTTILSYIMIE